jgi:hypothetical protein
MKNNRRYMQNVINSGDLEVISKLNGSNLLDSFQQQQVTAILKHTGYILDQDAQAKHFLNKTGVFVCKALMALGFVAVVSSLIGCDKTQVVNIDRDPDIINNTYVTNLLEEYYVTNVTEQYITEEYYEVTNIQGAQIEIVPLCPNIPGDFPEVLLRIDGVLVAYFAQNGDAKKARLVVVAENVNLATTDSRNCRFRVVNGQVQEL